MTSDLTLVSHSLCPYVQRAAIALAEKGVAFERVTIDLADKPDWFREVSPLGKVPLLKTGEVYLFESAPILEYLEDSQPLPLHPRDPVERARHRAYIEFGSQVLNGIGALYNAADRQGFEKKAGALREKFLHLERELDADGPFFSGSGFSLVDATFGPVFRYFDVFDRLGRFGILDGLEQVGRWRENLATRTSVIEAVAADYPEDLTRFLKRRNSWISALD